MNRKKIIMVGILLLLKPSIILAEVGDKRNVEGCGCLIVSSSNYENRAYNNQSQTLSSDCDTETCAQKIICEESESGYWWITNYKKTYEIYTSSTGCLEPVPPHCKQSEVDEAISQCGSEENIEWDSSPGEDPEFPQCSYKCKDNDCNDEYEQLMAKCTRGVGEFNWQTCQGKCNGCDDALDTVRDICMDKGGVWSFKCRIHDSLYPDERVNDVKYLCVHEEPQEGDDPLPPPPEDTEDGQSPSDPPEGQDPQTPPDPNNPDNQPTPDPADSPDASPDEITSNWTKSLKENSDTQIDQNNDQIGQLNDIVENTKTIADNQGKIQDEIKHNSDVTKQGTDKIDSSVNDLEETNSQGFNDLIGKLSDLTTTNEGMKDSNEAGTQSIIDAINNQDENSLNLSRLSTNLTAPDVPEFNADLPTDNIYTEFDDLTTLATESAETYAAENLIIDPESSPINAEVTATGDPCITGSISLRGTVVPISICFNEPWMLQGYAIMKVIFIGIAYLQTAILINRGIGG